MGWMEQRRDSIDGLPAFGRLGEMHTHAQRDKEGRQYVKQGVIDALARDNRLVDGTLPLFFFEADQRRLSFKGASKVCACGVLDGRSHTCNGWMMRRGMIQMSWTLSDLMPAIPRIADHRVLARGRLPRRACPRGEPGACMALTGRSSLGASPAPPSIPHSIPTLEKKHKTNRNPKYLDLSGCFLLGDSAVPIALSACPGLRSLKLENCRKMTDAALGHVVEASVDRLH